jgi:hypothetical protein
MVTSCCGSTTRPHWTSGGASGSRPQLGSREFTPVIEAILDISSISTPSRWTVRTDRGVTELLLPGEEALQRVGGKSLLAADAAGVQYLIRDIPALDRASRKFLERFL